MRGLFTVLKLLRWLKQKQQPQQQTMHHNLLLLAVQCFQSHFRETESSYTSLLSTNGRFNNSVSHKKKF